MNFIFIILSIVTIGIILYKWHYDLDTQIDIYIGLVAIVIKLCETSLRMIETTPKQSKRKLH